MPTAPLRVLLIEDDEDDHLLTQELLREVFGTDFELEWVTDADAGRAALRRGCHDVCLLDYRLGGCTGLELLREAVADNCPCPIIVLTGLGDRSTDMEAMRAGAADYLVKGRIDAARLERSIRHAIERKRAEQELRRARDELEQRVRARTAELERANAALREADQHKDEFLALLAHELRNPLAPIRNSLHLLQARADDPATVHGVRELLDRQVTHLARLVDDLLDAARIAQGKIQLQPGRLDLARVVADAAEDQRLALEANHLRLEIEVPAEPVWVDGDPVRLAQVTGNLLHNAAKFTDPGGRVMVRVGVDGAGRASFTVADTGIGIEPHLLPRLFEKFTQADRTLARSRGGLGLGLALVRGLVELHGGAVRAWSEGPGKGSAFTCTFPLQPPPAEERPAPGQGSVRGGPRRVLIIEDNRDSADSLSLLLQLGGHDVVVAYNGRDGIAQARRFRPDVVLCDLGLPGMTGFEVARALRDDPATATARLIAVSGYGQDEDQRRARAAGFDDHLIKPVDPELLQDRVARTSPTGGEGLG
jgi:signal transduction histidine kinase